MASGILHPSSGSAASGILTGVRDRAERIPWYLWAGLIASTSAVVGGVWDISWHRSIGRDTFWTPAHMAIYLCGLIAGFGGGAVVLLSTFGSQERNAATVKLWGFRAPLGIFMGIWGAVAMITSAPFDDWWHNAYGLDVKILSPPHVLLAMGIITIQLGVLIQVLGAMNRAGDAARRRTLEWMYLFGAALVFLSLQTVLMETSHRSNMHQAGFYKVLVPAAVVVLVGIARACGQRWSATLVAGIYTVFTCVFVWILPLFPAEPKLGPVYQQLTFFIPPEFPLMFLVPAVLLDLLIKRLDGMNKWLLSAVCGAVFLAAFVAAQWPFASFLMTPAARNWFFGAHYMPYYLPPTSLYATFRFFPPESTGAFLKGMGIAMLLTVLFSRLSLAWGDWMRKIQR